MKFKYFSARGKKTRGVELSRDREQKRHCSKSESSDALLTIHLFTCVLFKISPEEGAKNQE